MNNFYIDWQLFQPLFSIPFQASASTKTETNDLTYN